MSAMAARVRSAKRTRAAVHAQGGQVEGDGRAGDASGGAAPEALGLELLEGARVVVVELDERVAGRADRLVGHRATGRVHAARPPRVAVWMPTAEMERGCDHRLDARRLGGVAPEDVGDLRVGLDGQALGRLAVAGEAEVHARDAHVGSVGPAGQQGRDVVIDEGHDELVHVEEGQPLDGRPVEAQGMRVGIHLAAGQRPVHQRQQAVVDPRLDDLVEGIAAAVVVDEEVLHPEGMVVGQPLLEVGRLVADDDDDAEPQARCREQGPLADDVGGCAALALATGSSTRRLRPRPQAPQRSGADVPAWAVAAGRPGRAPRPP